MTLRPSMDKAVEMEGVGGVMDVLLLLLGWVTEEEAWGGRLELPPRGATGQQYPALLDRQAKQCKKLVRIGSVRFCSDRTGSGRTGPIQTGSRRTGSMRFGSNRTGSDRFESVRFGPDRFGSVRFGPDRFGSVRFGPDRTGSDRFGSDRFGSDRTASPS